MFWICVVSVGVLGAFVAMFWAEERSHRRVMAQIPRWVKEAK